MTPDEWFPAVPRLTADGPPAFPDTTRALQTPPFNGLLASGGQLTPEWLLHAYRRGIFPWYEDDTPILWWTPDPRCILETDAVRIRRSLRKQMKKAGWRVTFDTDFEAVITACAETPRRLQLTETLSVWSSETWITEEMRTAYLHLHHMGHAHSVEVFWEDTLVGGLYGVQIGRMFFGESMFSHRSDASKIALVCLAHQLHAWGFRLIDCQTPTDHLLRMGATLIPRARFENLLAAQLAQPFPPDLWHEITPPQPQAIARLSSSGDR